MPFALVSDLQNKIDVCNSIYFMTSRSALNCPSLLIFMPPSERCAPCCTFAFTSLFFFVFGLSNFLVFSRYVHWYICFVVPCALFCACCSTYYCRFLYCCSDDLLLLLLPYCIFTATFRIRYTSITTAPRELCYVREKKNG